MTHSEEGRCRQPCRRRPCFGHRKPSWAEREPERLSGPTAQQLSAGPGGAGAQAAAVGPPSRLRRARHRSTANFLPAPSPPLGSGAAGGRRLAFSLPPRSGAGRRPQPRGRRGGRRRPRAAGGSAWPLPPSRWRAPLPPQCSGGCPERGPSGRLRRSPCSAAGCGRPGRAAGCPARETRRCGGRLSPATSRRCRPTWCRAAGASASSSAPTPKVTRASPGPAAPRRPPAAPPAARSARAAPRPFPLLPGGAGRSRSGSPRCGRDRLLVPTPQPAPRAARAARSGSGALRPTGHRVGRRGAGRGGRGCGGARWRGEACGSALGGSTCRLSVWKIGGGFEVAAIPRFRSFMPINDRSERYRGARVSLFCGI